MYDLIHSALAAGLHVAIWALGVVFCISLLRDIRLVIRGKH